MSYATRLVLANRWAWCGRTHSYIAWNALLSSMLWIQMIKVCKRGISVAGNPWLCCVMSGSGKWCVYRYDIPVWSCLYVLTFVSACVCLCARQCLCINVHMCFLFMSFCLWVCSARRGKQGIVMHKNVCNQTLWNRAIGKKEMYHMQPCTTTCFAGPDCQRYVFP